MADDEESDFEIAEDLEKSMFKVKDRVLVPKVYQEIKPIPKRSCCINHCFRKMGDISSSAIEFIKISLKCCKIEQKNFLLNTLILGESLGDYQTAEDQNFYFVVDNVRFCVIAYSEITGVSQYLLMKIRKDFNSVRRVNYEHGNRGKLRKTRGARGFNSMDDELQFTIWTGGS